MKTIYFVYSDIQCHDGWYCHGIFTDEGIAMRYMLQWAKKEYKEHKQYCHHMEEKHGFNRPVPSFREYLAQEFKIVAKQVVETLEDAQKLTCNSYVVDLATGKVEQTASQLDFRFDNEVGREPHFTDSEKIAMEDDTCDCVWTCGNTEKDALDKLKKWLKEQLKNYPTEAVKPHESLLE